MSSSTRFSAVLLLVLLCIPASLHAQTPTKPAVKTARGSVSGRALLEGRTVHIPDVDTDPDFTFDRIGMRSVLGVPMLREGVPIGVLGFARSDVRPFSRLTSSPHLPTKRQ